MNKAYPEFSRMVDLVSSLNQLQKKRIHNFISSQGEQFWEDAESLCISLNSSFLRNDDERLATSEAYIRMSMDFLKEQIRFKKTGIYLLQDAGQANIEIYNNSEVMSYYMIGLLLSYLLWPNHYKMLRFFEDYLDSSIKIDSYLDVAPGHGLFAAKVMRKYPTLKCTLLDISPTSIAITSRILQSFQIDSHRFDLIEGDFLVAPIEGDSFDFISMGEVLEHVNDPLSFLIRARNLLHDDGHIFMTTCTNAPALDHIYHFKNVNEIREMIHAAGLNILNEEVLPAEDVPEELCEIELVTINYCCILEKA